MYRYTEMMGLLDGNPPWSHTKLRDLGQGHRANFNLRESEGIVDSAKTPYYDLVFEVPFFAQISFDVDGVDAHIRSTWNNIMAEEYFETLSAWIGFDQNIQLHQWQMIVNGVGPIFWPHGFSWKSEATKARKVLVPMETKANVEELELCAVLHSFRADQLESYIAGAQGDEHDGWNVRLCERAIIDSANREMRQEWGIENYDLYQRAIRTGDLFHGIHRSSVIYVATLFIKEFGGKISQYIVTDQNLGQTAEENYEGEQEETGYLYKKRKKYDHFSQVICPFFYDTGPDGTWHSVKGLGPKIYDFCDVSNRTFCQMLDGSVIGSGITLEAQDSASLEETQIALVGGATVVQPGYKVVQTRIAEALQGAMSMRRELQGVLQSNTGSYRQRPGEEERPEPTLGQEQILNQAQALLSRGSTTRYYNSLDLFHTETLRRLLDPTARQEKVPGGREAKEFYERCISAGIPEELMDFKHIRKVRAVRSLGYGSPQLRDMATKELVSMIPMMDEVGKNHALRARAAALPGIGQRQVDEFFPPIEKKGVPNSHTALAVLENNALRTLGGQAEVEPQQNHSIHFDTHMQDAVRHMQQQGAQPHDQLIHLEQAGPHMLEHLNYLKGDPTRKAEVKQKQKDLNKLSKTADQLKQQVEERAKAAPPPPNGQPSPELAKVQGDLALKATKLKGEMKLKEQKQGFTEQLQDKKTAADMRRKRKTEGSSPVRK